MTAQHRHGFNTKCQTPSLDLVGPQTLPRSFFGTYNFVENHKHTKAPEHRKMNRKKSTSTSAFSAPRQVFQLRAGHDTSPRGNLWKSLWELGQHAMITCDDDPSNKRDDVHSLENKTDECMLSLLTHQQGSAKARPFHENILQRSALMCRA